MTHNHWSDRFPYLVPVWHSLSQRNLSSNSANYIDPNLAIDFGGIGMYKETIHRRNQRLVYSVNRPTLPFYVSPVRGSNRIGRNCLAYSAKKNILFSCHNQEIHGLNVNIDERQFKHDTDNIKSNTPHLFSVNYISKTNPFRFHVDHIWNFKDKTRLSRDVLDIKLYEDDCNLEIITHSRNSLKIYKFCDESGSDENDHLRLINDIDSNTALFPFENALLHYWSRNTNKNEEFLSSFMNNNSIYRWNVEEKTMFVERSMNTDLSDFSNNLIGIEWAHTLNPLLYFYGTHKEIFLGDSRLRPNGSQKPSLSIIKASQFTYFNPTEMFQTFIANPLEAHQVITSSNFNINFLDIRFPQKNIFQCKHMFTSNLANKLYAKFVHLDGLEKMLLFSSNSEQLCLYTFDSKTCVQPIMQHSPYYLNLPNDLNAISPLIERTSFIKGFQVLPGKCQFDNRRNFFSVALLINSGDIYMQDFQSLSSTPSASNVDFSLDEFSKNYLNVELDQVTMDYLDSVYKCVNDLKLREKTLKRSWDSANNDNLLNHCKSSSADNLQDHFCARFQMSSEVEEEMNLLNETDCQNFEIVSTECNVSDDVLRWRDKDQIDFNLFRENWQSIPGRSDLKGVRTVCNPVTVSVCDKWFHKLEQKQRAPD